MNRCRTIRALAVLLLLTMVPGCTTMLESTLLEPNAPGGCLNSAGVYFLPRKLITVKVKGEDRSGGKTRGFGLDVGEDFVSIADRSESYCLDYLGLPTSRDEIGIRRTDEGLLSRIYTRAEDKSVEIAKTLIDTGFLLAGARGRAGLITDNAAVELASFQFDPFDPVDAAKINSALRPYGYCVFVEGFSFPPGLSPLDWCERPRDLSIHVFKALGPEVLPPASEFSRRGVLYRPNITRTLTVMRKADPYGRDPWLLALMKQIEVPNRAPTLLVEVNRSLFVDRITDIEFSEGVLTNISVKKPSEAAAFVEIPLAVATAVAALPGLVVKLKINDANNRERLIRAQTALIGVRRQHTADLLALNRSLNSGAFQPAPGAIVEPGGNPSAGPPVADREATIQNCLTTGRPRSLCEQQWSDIAQ
jgi:hypothetical protein